MRNTAAVWIHGSVARNSSCSQSTSSSTSGRRLRWAQSQGRKAPPNRSPFEDRFQIGFFGGVVELHAALDMVEVLEHQALGARRVALGNGLDDLRMLIGTATRRRRR